MSPTSSASAPASSNRGAGDLGVNSLLSRFNTKILVIVIAMVLVASAFLVLHQGTKTQTVTAYFDRTVSIYKGSELRVMGVKIGTVTAVVPEGDRVRVAMKYDSEYKLPADAKAAIITPTLTADRFVQIAPAYTRGPVMADGAKIALKKTGTPVELDRIYQSLSDLTQALGPNGANKNGALDDLLTAGTKALKGNGKLGNETLLNLSAAVQTFGDSSGPLFDSVKNMSQLTNTLAANDKVVNGFMSDLTSVSSQLADERGNLRKALAALAAAVSTVRSFVHDNKGMVEKNVRQLSDVVGVLAKQKESLNTVARLGALGLSNLVLAYDQKSGSIGARVQFGPTAAGLGEVLCDVVQNSNVPNAGFTCNLLEAITKPFTSQLGSNPIDAKQPQLKLGGNTPVTSLDGLLTSLKAGNR
jgi:phospholipid/cholesterol/gamma-HCH transport system substrate-binding protein